MGHRQHRRTHPPVHHRRLATTRRHTLLNSYDNSHHNGSDHNAGDHNAVGDNGDHNGAGGGGNGFGDHANTGGQVTKVPVGSVDTGDGSTTAGTGLVSYLVACALILAGAGAGAGAGAAVTRRLRRDS
jgi:hypothetical protein